MGDDPFLFNHENILRQLETAEYNQGYYLLKFYADDGGKPADHATARIEQFYLSPSGGTLRDNQMNLVLYDSRYDTYRGFRPPRSLK